jgi:hypothetical protein
MKKDSLFAPIFFGFIFIILAPVALIFLALNALTPPDGGVLTDCVVTEYAKVGRQSTVYVDYVNSEGKTINANISNGIGGGTPFIGQHYECYVYEDNPFEVYRKPGALEGKLMYAGAGVSALIGIIIIALLLKKRGKQGFLIKNGQQAQAELMNVRVKSDSSGFSQYVCDYTFTDSRGQMHMGSHTFLPGKRVSNGDYFTVVYAEKNGKMVSDLIDE